MPVAQTSIMAWVDTVEERGAQAGQVLKHIREHPGGRCISDIAFALCLRESSVSPRINELKKMGLLMEVEKRPSLSTGRNSKHYIATDGGV